MTIVTIKIVAINIVTNCDHRNWRRQLFFHKYKNVLHTMNCWFHNCCGFLRNLVLYKNIAIWYHLYSSKNMKNTHWGVPLLVKLQVTLLLLHGYFSRSLSWTNDTKSCKAYHMLILIHNKFQSNNTTHQ